MKLYVKNTLTGLVPMYPADLDEKKRLKLGEEYEVSIRRPRNVKFHRLFFQLLNVGHQNTQLELPFEAYRKYVVMKAGYFNSYQTPKGVFFEAQSISFSSMDEDTFKGVFDKVLDIIIQDIGVEKEDVMAVLDEYS
jgi:hypothetical protein